MAPLRVDVLVDRLGGSFPGLPIGMCAYPLAIAELKADGALRREL
jgi:hypothetical protein